VLPHGTGHVLCDRPGSACITVDPAWVRTQPRPLRLTTKRRGISDLGDSEIMCGNYTVASPRTHPVLTALPKVIHLPGKRIMADASLHATMQQLQREFAAADIGSQTVVSRLLDVLFVQVLRDWLDTQPTKPGWLGALRDEPIGNALGLLHQAYARPWTVRSLAREVGLSRPVFARRFHDKVGDTPMGYLRTVRIEAAARRLGETTDSIAAIANAVGYTSEYAFNRAFHRERGTPPGRFRKRATPAARP
jgi:transcriptional regulator GlxA family with amidase domain